jgi:hypothetical protein
MPEKKTSTARKTKGVGTSTTTKRTTRAKDDPLAPYLQPVRQGEWALTEGGRSLSLYGTQESVERRAREILASRGVTV